MEKGDEDFVYIIDTMEKGQEKIQELRTENEKLVEANEKLVDLVKKLENIIVAKAGEDFDWEGNQYDYPHKWAPSEIVHDKNLDLDTNFDLEDIDSQISEAIKSMKRAQKFKNE